MTSPQLQRLQEALDPAEPIFVLIDPYLGDPMLTTMDDRGGVDLEPERKSAWQRPIARVALHERIPLRAHRHPYLVQLNGIDDPLLQTTLEMAQEEAAESKQGGGLDGSGQSAHRIAGWLQSSLLPQALAGLLAPLMRLDAVGLTKATYLRVADRRVLALLRCVVGDERLGATFARLQRWVYLDVQGALDTLNTTGETSAPLRLSLAELRRLEAGPLVHASIAVALSEAARPSFQRSSVVALLDVPAAELSLLAYQALQITAGVARDWPLRFTGSEDHVVWAALILLHPELRQAMTPAVAAVLRTPKGDDPPEPVRYLHAEIRTALP